MRPGDTGPLPFRELTGYGLRLRAWREDDARDALRGLRDPESQRWAAGMVQPSDLAGVLVMLKKRAERVTAGDLAPFCIADAGSDAVLGSVELHTVNRGMGHGGVGYWLLPDARGRGVVTRAVELVTRWGFDDVGLHRLDLGHALENTASCRVAARCGYLLEGTMRGFLPTSTPGVRHDTHLHARLSTDPAPGVV
ncbi:GNAT family N-acetyltransferase [Streptomyces sp. NPDC050560]|uniref:GNAT family N-acetyltransferase n=1 Tax=Streptomyces sp. NPDC050560 TaxID=3365630 RepID=UPI0037B2D153